MLGVGWGGGGQPLAWLLCGGRRAVHRWDGWRAEQMQQSLPALRSVHGPSPPGEAGNDQSSPPSLSPSRLSDRGPAPPVPDHPRPRPELHPPAAAPGVDHHAALHRPGHHFPHPHLWSDGDVALALRGLPLRTVDRLPGEYVSPLFPFTPTGLSFAKPAKCLSRKGKWKHARLHQ